MTAARNSPSIGVFPVSRNTSSLIRKAAAPRLFASTLTAYSFDMSDSAILELTSIDDWFEQKTKGLNNFQRSALQRTRQVR
jgi:hypothetical protein